MQRAYLAGTLLTIHSFVYSEWCPQSNEYKFADILFLFFIFLPFTHLEYLTQVIALL